MKLKFLVPLLLFAGVATALGVGLTIRPGDLPSVMINKQVPVFDLPPLLGRQRGLASNDLAGEVRLVNFFASWCFACRLEHPLLNRINADGIVPVYGINYKDRPEDAKAWLDRLGDPYARSGADFPGRTGIDWGVYGLPETFIVDRDSRIVYRHIGAINASDLENCLLPVVENLRASELAATSINLPSACQRSTQQIDLKSKLQTKS
jgi:cytochrome c biogenesis protein CcmG/thiol:disulfide interchange protein DsbE